MNIRFTAVAALAAVIIATPALARTRSNTDDTSTMNPSTTSQQQDNSTQKQRHSRHQHKKRHASRHHKKQDSQNTNTLQQ